jgi:hypothetical protein
MYLKLLQSMLSQKINSRGEEMNREMNDLEHINK